MPRLRREEFGSFGRLLDAALAAADCDTTLQTDREFDAACHRLRAAALDYAKAHPGHGSGTGETAPVESVDASRVT